MFILNIVSYINAYTCTLFSIVFKKQWQSLSLIILNVIYNNWNFIFYFILSMSTHDNNKQMPFYLISEIIHPR